ncbi:MAG: formamidopyrimidine-DNA glycosylase [Bryobacterales bacterium]|nr:formamidopyrimidine-DNA glycosylase [Bryobacterales bacterium]
MPELPDIVVYIEAIEKRILGQVLGKVRISTPFLLRTVDPPVSAAEGRKVIALRRLGKRIAIGVERDIWLALHLMIAGRLHWKKPGVALKSRNNLAAFDFGDGSLLLTEAGTERRASLHMASGEEGLASMDRGGLEVLETDAIRFREVLQSENHTLKRALTDPELFSGIGNAYSDEILHRARLSPATLTQKLKPDEIERLFHAVQSTLLDWVERLRKEAAGKFPENVTAFRDDMAVHGKFKQPCPVCGTPVARIRYASNETNYCPKCQTGGKVLADRALSRLLK